MNTLNQEFDKQKAEIRRLKEELVQLKRKHENRCDELQEMNVALNGELQRERTVNVTLAQKVELLVKEIEDATASAASSSFSKFSKEEFKELAIESIGNTIVWSVSYSKL